MDNFRKHKSFKMRKPIEGITPRGVYAKRGPLEGSLNTNLNSPRRLLDDFKKQDSFRPIAGSLNNPNSTSPKNSTILPKPQEKPNILPDMRLDMSLKTEKKKRRPSRILRKRVLVSVLLVGFIIASVYGGLSLKAWQKIHQIFKGGANTALSLIKDIDPSRLKAEGDGRINIILTGNSSDDPNHGGAELTDSIMVLSIDPIGKSAAILSVPRDLWVNIKPYGYNKINAAYVFGEENHFKQIGYPNDGIGLLQRTLEEVLGIQIHYHVVIDFTAFKEAINAVGGIDINLDQAIYDPNFDWQYGKNALKLPKGQVHLDGTKALLLGRSRNAAGGYGVGDDFSRSENQRKMLLALKDKTLSLQTFGDPSKIYKLIEAAGKHVSTDISFDDMSEMYKIGKDLPSAQIRSLGFTTPPNNLIRSSSEDGLSILVPIAGKGIYKDIQSFVHNELKDGYLKNENAKIAVLNGSDIAGLASRRAEDLKSFGYSISAVTNSAIKVDKTLVVDLTKGAMKYTKRYLEIRNKTSAVTELPAGITQSDADFVIILGNNETLNQDN